MIEDLFDIPITKKEDGNLIYRVESYLNAPVKLVWEKLTTPQELLRWDSMLMEFEGEISYQGKIKLRSKISPNQTFSLKIVEFSPYDRMVWSSGISPIFKGERSYIVRPYSQGTYFKMEETFGGIMLPLMKKMLPDCNTLFGTYIKDLKEELKKSKQINYRTAFKN